MHMQLNIPQTQTTYTRLLFAPCNSLCWYFANSSKAIISKTAVVFTHVRAVPPLPNSSSVVTPWTVSHTFAWEKMPHYSLAVLLERNTWKLRWTHLIVLLYGKMAFQKFFTSNHIRRKMHDYWNFTDSKRHGIKSEWSISFTSKETTS